jgi:hypothetical protein
MFKHVLIVKIMGEDTFTRSKVMLRKRYSVRPDVVSSKQTLTYGRKRYSVRSDVDFINAFPGNSSKRGSTRDNKGGCVFCVRGDVTQRWVVVT